METGGQRLRINDGVGDLLYHALPLSYLIGRQTEPKIVGDKF